MSEWPVRPPQATELAELARLWRAAWMEVHAEHVPVELTRRRSFEDFRRRLDGFGDSLRTAGPDGAPLGLCVIRDAEMHQLFLAPEARGSGLAARLLADAEARLAAAGVDEAWLDVVVQNRRAQRFYAAHGWRDRGIESVSLPTISGPVTIQALVMVKQLSRPG